LGSANAYRRSATEATLSVMEVGVVIYD